ncbi:MAG: hypothetical protein JRI66_12545 [Deltaproteobacteria bacterium]|nr:hypothetical protein [Deltaproteobacteria bacterium]
MRLRLGFQPRLTYLNRDKDVVTEPMKTESNAYFKFRRLRLIFDGHAWKDYKYLIQVQLEPNQEVNVHDAAVWYGRYKFLQPWVGRGKVAYGLEFWQSGFKLNFVERSIFSGETDNHWPGVNADFRGPSGSAKMGVGNKRYNTAGFNLYRSQGFMLMGDLDLWAPRNLRYWAGIRSCPCRATTTTIPAGRCSICWGRCSPTRTRTAPTARALGPPKPMTPPTTALTWPRSSSGTASPCRRNGPGRPTLNSGPIPLLPGSSARATAPPTGRPGISPPVNSSFPRNWRRCFVTPMPIG